MQHLATALWVSLVHGNLHYWFWQLCYLHGHCGVRGSAYDHTTDSATFYLGRPMSSTLLLLSLLCKLATFMPSSQRPPLWVACCRKGVTTTQCCLAWRCEASVYWLMHRVLSRICMISMLLYMHVIRGSHQSIFVNLSAHHQNWRASPLCMQV
jgi:hypothetical protein